MYSQSYLYHYHRASLGATDVVSTREDALLGSTASGLRSSRITATAREVSRRYARRNAAKTHSGNIGQGVR